MVQDHPTPIYDPPHHGGTVGMASFVVLSVAVAFEDGGACGKDRLGCSSPEGCRYEASAYEYAAEAIGTLFCPPTYISLMYRKVSDFKNDV